MIATRTPGVALWISLVAGALVLGLGAGTAWWFLVGRGLEHADALRHGADDLVFTGDDLHFFLLGEKSLAAAGLPVTLEPVETGFTANGETTENFEPAVCGTLYGNLTQTPAGARGLSGSINQDGTDAFSQQVIQFATVDEAIDAVDADSATVAACGTFTIDVPDEEPRSVTLSTVTKSDGTGPAVALLSEKAVDSSWSRVVIRQANVVVVAGYVNLTGTVSDDQARALGLAVHERAVYASAKKRAFGE